MKRKVRRAGLLLSAVLSTGCAAQPVVEVSKTCHIDIPADYTLARKDEAGFAYYSDVGGTGFITVKFGDFTAKLDELSKAAEASPIMRNGDRVVWHRVERRGAFPMPVTSLWAKDFAVMITGKDAPGYGRILASCMADGSAVPARRSEEGGA